MNRPIALAAPAVVAMPAVAAFWFFGIGDPGDAGEPPAVLLPPNRVVRQVDATVHLPVSTYGNCVPEVNGEFMEENQIVSYYGNPYVPAMGILGELQPEELVARVKAHARRYDEINGTRGVQPALHMVYASAQPEPGADGRHLLFVDPRTVWSYVDLACRHGLLVFLDIQVGLSDAKSEITNILPYLEAPHVHVALDPEFAMPPGEIPGRGVGSLDAGDINAAQEVLQRFVGQRHLADKILVVHQFLNSMVTGRELIDNYANVRLVIDADGIGQAEMKRVQFSSYTAHAEYSGIKLFFRQDAGLMREEDVAGLEPDVIIYH